MSGRSSQSLHTYAPVKDQYVLHMEEELLSKVRERSPSLEPDTVDDKQSRKKKTKRGQNKSRRKEMRRSDKKNSLPKLCNFVAQGQPCTFPKCRFSHDGEGYLALKPPDISDQCPLMNAKGACRWGLQCRYYSGHARAQETREAYEGEHEYGKVHNEFSKTFLHTLRKQRKRKYAEYAHVPEIMKCHQAYKARKKSDSPFMKIFDIKEKLDRKPLDLRGKTYLAPLTTCGNLPFRRLCKTLGCEVTCSEMAMCSRLLDATSGEWALLQRHPSEDIFGIQILTGHIDEISMTVNLINENINCDFIDLNCGCPLDDVCKGGRGAGLMRNSPKRLRHLMRCMSTLSDVPVTCKLRMGYIHSKPIAHEWVANLVNDGIAAIGLHGRSRQQRYRRPANWDYIKQTADVSGDVQFIGNGDVYSFEEWNQRLSESGCDTLMIGRGALIKPWIFTEIKEQRNWDISAQERLEQFKQFANYGLEQWGCDLRGVDNTRRFMLEWLSFTYRYIPLGILERPVTIGERPPYYVGRNDLETLLASGNVKDWIKITEMFLGPTQDGFTFIPKHKANAWKLDASTIIDNIGRETKKRSADDGDDPASKRTKLMKDAVNNNDGNRVV